MSKQKKGRKQQPSHQQPNNRSKRKSLAVGALVLCRTLTGMILAQWRNIRTSFSPLTPVPTPTPTLQLSKEYIYAGGKLIATEEPASGGGPSPLSPPSALIATGTSAPQINLTWTASTGGTAAKYQVERCQSYGQNCYSFVADVLSNPSTSTYTYIDSGIGANSAYLYRVRAVDSQNNFTNYSNVDLATTVTFDNDPLVSYAENPNNATPISAIHFTQLRDAINAVRLLVDPNAAPFQWTTTNTTPAPQIGGGIYRSHLLDLRTNLGNALSALGLPGVNYQYPTITSQVSPIHKKDIQELRDAVK